MPNTKQITAAVVLATAVVAVAALLRPATEEPAPALVQEAVPVAAVAAVEHERLAQGKSLYQQYCAACHGALVSAGDSWRRLADRDQLPAPPHDDRGQTWQHPHWQLMEMIRGGVAPFEPEGWAADMPAFEDELSEEQVLAVLAYIRSHWSARSLEFQRQREAAEPASR